MQNCRQSSSSRTTISRVDAKQQRRHCLLELAEARQLCFVCLGLHVDALLFCTAAESFERRAAQLDQYFSAVWGMHHGNGAPAGVYKSSAVACLNSFWSIEGYWGLFDYILLGIYSLALVCNMQRVLIIQWSLQRASSFQMYIEHI